MRIYRYTLDAPDGNNVLLLPAGAEVLKVARRECGICLWALVDPDADITTRVFNVYGTGWNIPPNPRQYIDTVFDGSLVWHIFEVLQ
jgi:hypothetical protein